MRKRSRRCKMVVALSIDPTAHDLAVAAADRAGLRLATWAERAIARTAWDELRELHREECGIRRRLARGG